jgi:hypothetical protein
MTKRHLIKRLQQVNPWYFLALALLSTLICIFALRANNEHMVKLRDAVYAADKADGDTQSALKNLQAYVTAHMNTNLSSGPNSVYPPIQLKYTYDRLVQAQSAVTAKNNTEIYSEAQAHCEAINHSDFSGRNRVPCITDYVQSHGKVSTAPIPDALYKFSFVSPRWSPDLAGWSMVVGLISLAVFIVSYLMKRVIPH